MTNWRTGAIKGLIIGGVLNFMAAVGNMMDGGVPAIYPLLLLVCAGVGAMWGERQSSS